MDEVTALTFSDFSGFFDYFNDYATAKHCYT